MKKEGFFGKLFGKNADEEEGDPSSLDHEKREMIRGIVELSETTVREIMVPRIDVVSLALGAPLKELLEIILDSGYSRYPVYQDTIDNVVGVLYAKDLLRYMVDGDDVKWEDMIRTPYFVPEGKKINDLLREFRRRKVHIAIVVDEYGGTAGVVCFEDIIEEIVGDIQDEFDNEKEDILKIGESVYLCDARLNIEDLNDRLHLNLPNEDVDSLGGFVFNLIGKIPVQFEKVTFNNVDFIVQEMEGHKIISLKLVINPKKDSLVMQNEDIL